jgi:hypothetical protein
MQSLPELTATIQADKERAIRRHGPLPANPYAALAHPIAPVPVRPEPRPSDRAGARPGTIRPGVAAGG